MRSQLWMEYNSKEEEIDGPQSHCRQLFLERKIIGADRRTELERRKRPINDEHTLRKHVTTLQGVSAP